jgi:hypothetical protein
MVEKDIDNLKKIIDKYLLENNYENAFCTLIISLQKLDKDNMDDLVEYYSNFLFQTKTNKNRKGV